ncbi:hypothetical protein [uncultured Bilophila sp.]|uniref:hypothetical protein n=1 Tax=uncultured Bilophila sp. TaxID=529385 RepID=UPI00266EF830|nr:hypothetical protein [uncultured Bilophila sp.]
MAAIVSVVIMAPEERAHHEEENFFRKRGAPARFPPPLPYFKASFMQALACPLPNRQAACVFLRPCQGMRLFHLHSVVKIQPFSPAFPLAESMTKAFFRLFIWNFKKKASTVFYGTAFSY